MSDITHGTGNVLANRRQRGQRGQRGQLGCWTVLEFATRIIHSF